MIYLIKAIYSLLLPPGLFLLLLAVLIWRSWRKDRRWVWLPAALLTMIYLLSAGWFSDLLVRGLEQSYPQPSIERARHGGDVLVVLGGGATPDTPDLGGIGNMSGTAEARLLAAVRLHRALNLPVLFSGGQVFSDSGNEANIAGRQLLQLGLSKEDILLENRSLNTEQNALYSKTILENRGLKRPILITSAFHMKRAVLNFQQAGLDPLPFPVDYWVPQESVFYWSKLLPSGSSLSTSSTVLKEYLGILGMKLRR